MKTYDIYPPEAEVLSRRQAEVLFLSGDNIHHIHPYSRYKYDTLIADKLNTPYEQYNKYPYRQYNKYSSISI